MEALCSRPPPPHSPSPKGSPYRDSDSKHFLTFFYIFNHLIYFTNV